MIDSLGLVAAASTALCLAFLLRSLLPSARALRFRIDPYLRPSPGVPGTDESGAVVMRVFGPPVKHAARALGRVLEKSGDEVGALRIRQAGWYPDMSNSEIWTAYRVAQLRSLAIGILAALALGQVFDLKPAPRLALVCLSMVVAVFRHRGALNKSIDRRRERMRAEIYTVNQVLSMRVRAGAAVMSAVDATVARGGGEVVGELEHALRLHRAGWRAGEAFRRVAELTPEPFCGRTYRLLATADERGAELATALLELAEDVREARRETLRRTATKRRAAILVPTIAVLAPVLILFIAAPLPFVITGWQ